MTALAVMHTAMGVTLGALVGCVGQWLGLRRGLPTKASAFLAGDIDEQLAILVVPGAQPLEVTAFLAGESR